MTDLPHLPQRETVIVVVHEQRGSPVGIHVGERGLLNSEHVQEDDIVRYAQLFQDDCDLPRVGRVGEGCQSYQDLGSAEDRRPRDLTHGIQIDRFPGCHGRFYTEKWSSCQRA